tara:strand:+ start:180 stop:374 length:195 start_codon:yes stop_codon:yes gene_type:complete
MKITKNVLKQIIKEELVLESNNTTLRVINSKLNGALIAIESGMAQQAVEDIQAAQTLLNSLIRE